MKKVWLSESGIYANGKKIDHDIPSVCTKKKKEKKPVDPRFAQLNDLLDKASKHIRELEDNLKSIPFSAAAVKDDLILFYDVHSKRLKLKTANDVTDGKPLIECHLEMRMKGYEMIPSLEKNIDILIREFIEKYNKMAQE